MSERVIDISGYMYDPTERWTIIPYDVKVIGENKEKISFRVKGLTCTFICNNGYLLKVDDKACILLNDTTDENGRDISVLLDSLVVLDSDKVLKYEWYDENDEIGDGWKVEYEK